MFYGLDGEFLFLVDSKELRLSPGTTITIPPGGEHNFDNVGDESARLLVIGASEEIAPHER